MYQVISYYQFHPIINPQQFCLEHKRKCRDLNLFGRIYVASEGINGSAAGRASDIETYKQYLSGLPDFEKIQFKEDCCDYIPFDRLKVKVRSELVTLKSSVKTDPSIDAAPHLSPGQWREMLESGEDFVLLDVRNNYESAIGHFDGAIRPDIENFFDFPAWLAQSGLDKNKKVLMYCTGGIRCEKFSALMRKQGFEDVNQLQGGILNYAKEENGKHFKGKCFVFDDRLTVPVEVEQKEPVGQCFISGVPCDTYINCANLSCNELFICSQEAAIRMEGCCSEACRTSPWKKPFNPDDIYQPTRRWHNYYVTKVTQKGPVPFLRKEYQQNSVS